MHLSHLLFVLGGMFSSLLPGLMPGMSHDGDVLCKVAAALLNADFSYMNNRQ